MCDNLLDQTMSLLRKDRGNWGHIAEASQVNYNWLLKLAQGHIDDPGVKKIQRLYASLSARYPEDACS